MTERIRFTAQLIAVLLAVLAVALIVTGATVMHDRRDCLDAGGRFTVEGTTTWCRY